MPSGYSGTPVIKKLGIKPGMRIRFIHPPEKYHATLGELPEDVTVAKATRGEFDFIQVFITSQLALDRQLPKLREALNKDGGMLWVSWPKKASGMKTDVTGDTVRTAGLNIGLVDIKVCAVDETWSGLKFVWRVKDR